MSVHLFDRSIPGTPPEPLRLEAVTVRLIEDSEQERFDGELVAKHYLKNANAVGRVLQYVAEYRGQWVALLVFSSPAFHIKLRDQWLRWPPRQVKERRHLIAQNAQFLVLAAPSQWPNLASWGAEVGLRTTAWGLAGALWLPGAGSRNVCGPPAVSGHLLQGRWLGAVGADPGL
jgi:hypothetical protein